LILVRGENKLVEPGLSSTINSGWLAEGLRHAEKRAIRCPDVVCPQLSKGK